MSFINKKPCAKTFLQLDDLDQRGAVSVHAVNRLDQDETRASRCFSAAHRKMVFQFLESIVRKDAHRCPAESRAIHETSVAKLVQNNHVAFPRQRGNCSQRRGVTAGKAQGGLGPLESRQRFLKTLMMPVRAANQSRGAHARAGLVERGMRCPAKIWMRCQSEVVVGREVCQQACVARHLRSLRRIEDAQGPAETCLLNLLELAREKPIEIHPFIKCSICFTAVSIPAKIARETMEWPMFSSTRWGIRRM